MSIKPTIRRVLEVALAMIVYLCPAWAQVDSLHIHSDYRLEQVSVMATPPPIIDKGTTSYLLNFEQLEQLPQFMGTTDAFRTMQLMSGVLTTGDIASGVYVQGCQPAHNLFLVNGAPVYNPVHLLGFISVLNGDHLKSLTMDKGYVSSQWGGRLASVMRVVAQDRVPERFETSLNINLISSALTLNAPLSDRGNLIVSGRMCNLSPVLSLLDGVMAGDLKLRYSLYDLNATLNYRFGASDRLSVNGFWGSDNVGVSYGAFQVEGDNSWSNGAASAIWRHTFSDDSWLETTLYHSLYEDWFSMEQSMLSANMHSRIDDSGVRINQYFRAVEGLDLNFGGEFSHRRISPQSSVLSAGDVDMGDGSNLLINNDIAAFADAEWRAAERLKFYAGLRVGGIVGYGLDLSPRFKAEVEVAPRCTVGATAMRQYQYVGQVLVSGTALPTNYFVGTSAKSPAQMSDNYIVEGQWYTRNRNWQLSSQLYYRKLHNQYENNSYLVSLFMGNMHFDDRYAVGEGENFGWEAMARYRSGRLTGWVSYTLGWALRNFDDIDGGARFYASNDRRHDLSVVGSYRLGRGWQISGNFIYASGMPVTVAKGLYVFGGQPFSRFSKKNAGRMPDYHRLDVSATKEIEVSWAREAVLSFSIYNLYGRQNGIFYCDSISYDSDYQAYVTKTIPSVLFTILPSVGVTFKF